MDPNFVLASRNLSNVSLLAASRTNCYDIVKADILILTKRAIPVLEGRLMRVPSMKRNRVSFVGAPLYLQPQIGSNPIATANREDFIDSLDATDRKSHGNELIKVRITHSLCRVTIHRGRELTGRYALICIL